MSFGLDFLGKIVTHRTYALTKQDGTKETLDEMADRIARLHTLKYRKQIYNHKDAYLFWYYLTRSRDLISRGILSPSMRSFNFAPEALLANNLRIFNCSSMQFQEKESGKKFHDLTQLSMCGCGIGVRVDGPVEIVPAAQKRNLYTIPDTREGWSKAVQLAVEYPDCKFDISLVRPKGSPISSGGYASGGEVLLDGLLKIQRVCKGKTVLAIEDVLDISAIILSFVQAGGSRRSAGIAIAPYSALKDYKSPENTANKQYRFYLNVSTYWDNLPDVKSALIDSLNTGEPGLVKYSMKSGICNACLSGEARLLSLTRGVITMNDLQIGEEIFDGEGWTKVLAKWSNGVRPTYKYYTTRGMFYGTDDHRVVENGVKVEVKDAKGIDGSWEPASAPICEIREMGEQEVWDITVDNDKHVFWTDGCIVSNCGEITSEYDTLLCNLTEVNVAGMEEFGAFLDAVVCATFLGTLQAGFTKGIEELHESFAKNYDEERGLGVSLTGAMQNDERIERWLKPGSDTRDIVRNKMKDTNKWVADMLGFREAARITTGKPSGSNSARLGVTSGFNPAVITHGYRRVTIEKHHQLYQKLKEKDPNGIFLQDCVWNPDSSSKFCIPCHWENAKVLSAQEHADWIARMTESWIELGHNRGEYTNSISTTIHCREEDITDEFVESLRKIGNVTLLAKEDHVYPQAPFEQLPWEEFKKVEAEFIEMFKDFDFSSVVYDTHHVFEREAACSAGGCELK